MNQRHAERTPSGTSFHRGDPDLGDLPHRVRPDPDGRYTVDVHVTPDGHARIGGHRYTPEEFADILRRNGDYDGRPIRLIGCDAGSNDFARRLARELDTEVLAPNKPAWTDSNGRVFSSDYEIGPDGKVRPKIPPNGEWDVHRPDGSTAGAGDHGFTPGTAGSDKDDLDADDARARGDDNGADDTDDTDTDTDAEDSGNPASGRTTSFDTDDWDEFELDEADPRFDERFVDFDRPGLGRSDAENPYHRPNETNGPPGKSPEETVMVEDAGRDHTPAGQHATPETIRRVPEYLERFLEGHPPKLRPHTEYPVVHTKDGHEVSRTRFYTDENGDIRWVELTPGTGPMPDGSGKKAPPNPDFDYPLLPETKYRVDNFNDPDKKWDFETDERGLTKYMTGEPEYRASNPMYRDEGGDYTAQGRAGEEGRQAYRNDPDHSDVHWAGGHFGANEAGGPPGYGNMHPQMRASNSGNNKDGWVASETWRTLERQLKKVDAMAGHDVELLQTASPRRGDGLAEEVTIRWRITEPGPDGESVTRVFERVFPVVPEKVYDDPSTVVRYA
ncbi:hypothetical protein ACFS2C_14440 [Prauserella oleivorans]|uniref:DNA/RNA non-specific endonuclease n=1 Tax=Prauserella oleivorans TaxID=1478153 RepID=A0ABW5W9G4_9PSEU